MTTEPINTRAGRRRAASRRAGPRWPRHVPRAAAFFAALLVSMHANAWPAPAKPKKWTVLENCKLLTNPSNDGDSFHVRHKRTEYLFRLYFVDTPETENSLPDRVREQSEYWGIDIDDTIALGKKATEFTHDFLKGSFTVYTKYEDAMGRSKLKRNFAMVKADDEFLSEALASRGLARLYGVGRDLPNGLDSKKHWANLRVAERQAKKQRVGGWAKQREVLEAPPPVVEKPSFRKGEERVLTRPTMVYSLTDPPRSVGTLGKGSRITLLEASPPAMLRVRFKGVEKTHEFRCFLSHLDL